VFGRGLHWFRFQLNLSSSVHHVAQLNPECVLELLKLSSDVNDCKPLVFGLDQGGAGRSHGHGGVRESRASDMAAAAAEAAVGHAGGDGLGRGRAC